MVWPYNTLWTLDLRLPEGRLNTRRLEQDTDEWNQDPQ